MTRLSNFMADNYIVSARKYRPDTFASIVGQGAMSTTLRTAVLQGRMAHAYLFCGPRGVGKTTAARVLAKTINCQHITPEGEACQQCESCRAFAQGRSFNIFELDAASNNSVDDIRALTEQVASPPIQGRYKVYIIDEVHMLSQAAFNAFLKTLEEPPAYAIFILATTERHKVLPTILSRCQIYDFRRITVMDITRHLGYVAASEGIEAEEAALSLIAEKADGGMRDALSMFDRVASFSGGRITYAGTLESLNVLDYRYYIRIVEGMTAGNYPQLLLTIDELLAKGFDGQIIITGLASFLRDLLVVQHPDTSALLEKPESIAQLYRETAQRISTAALHQAIKQLVACDQQYRSASNKRLLVELTLMNLLSLCSPTALGATPQVATPQVRPTPVSQPATPAERGAGVVSAQPQPSAAVAPQAAPTAPPAQVSAPAPQPAPSVQVAPAQPTSPPPSPQAPPAPSPEASAPAVVAPEPTPTSAVSVDQSASVRSARQSFRVGLQGRRAQAEARASQGQRGAEVAPQAEEHEPFAEEAMQRAWLAYTEEVLDSEALITRRLMRQHIPKLIGETTAEVGIPNTPALIDPVDEVLTQVVGYIRRQLHNTDLVIRIRPLEQEETERVPITAEDRFKVLAEANPALEELRRKLSLRLG